MRRCDLSHTVVVGSDRYRGVKCRVERRDGCMGEMGDTHIYRRWAGSSKCQKGGCHGGRGVGGPLDVGGHHPYTGVIGTFVARGRRDWARVLVFGFQERRLRSNNSPSADPSSEARDENLGVRGCVKQQPAPAENSSSDTTTLHKIIKTFSASWG